MNKKIKIEVSHFLERFFDKCIKNNINLYDIHYITDEKCTMIINLNDYKSIKKLNYYSDIKIVKYEGLLGIKKHVKDNIYFYLIFIFCFALMDIITSYIVDINIIHENKSIRNLVNKELEEHNIKKYSLAYDFDELEKIKNEILKDNPTTLEWMSITKEGMKYVIRVEERIIKNPVNEEGYRHVIASKDGKVTKILSTKGDVLVRSGEYVKKGQRLISGEITLYDNIKGNTLATGSVYGDVWYTAKIAYPKKEAIKTETGKTRYNLNINNKIFLKNKYKYFYQENKKEIKILGLKIKIYKEKEYNIKVSTLKDDEVIKKATEKVENEFITKLKNTGEVKKISVLEKNFDDEYGYIEFFVMTNEIISEYSSYEVNIN